MYALADCNNFFASCQRVFRPDLEGKPIVVLSNNDGCIIARSNEAKALGIPMAAPEFQWKQFFKQNNVHVFSSNYALYGDMSARVMSILESFEPNIEIYSIDEAFLDITDVKTNNLRDFALDMQKTTQQWTGIPLSIGLGPTKTLAKIAVHVAKKHSKSGGVCLIKSAKDADFYLRRIQVGDVWGVGKNWAKKLNHNGIVTASDLALSNHSWIRKRYSVVLQRTAMELAGKPCIQLENIPARKQILVSRSFRPKVSDQDKLYGFIAAYISRAAEKLRDQKSLSKCLTIFIRTKNQKSYNKTNYHQENYYGSSKTIRLSQYTADTATLIRAGIWGLSKLYKPGYEYYQAGIWLDDLIPEKNQQYALFSPAAYDETSRQRMQLLDAINQRFGPASLRIAREPKQRWQMYQQHLSLAYTTRWDELLQVK